MKLFSIFITLLLAVNCRAEVASTAVLAELNLARTNPQAYAAVLAGRLGPQPTAAGQEAIRFLQRAEPLGPLALMPGMSRAAELHIAQQGAKGGRGHGNPWSRLGRYGQWLGTAGENIFYGRRDARGIVCALIVDEGVRGRGHRKNIFNRAFSVVGIAHGGHARYGAMCVQDFAGGWVERGGAVAAR